MKVDPDKPTDTPEQAEIKRLRQGFHVVSANAGTGKTHTIAQLIAGLYLELERQLYPTETRNGQHVTGDDQIKILRQILAVTFTRDAAGELDDRIYLNLAEQGIEEARDRWGRRYRISRTIDSYVQGWMRRPMVIQELLKSDDDMVGCIDNKVRLMSPAIRAHLSNVEGKGQRDSATALRVGFVRRWPWLQGERLNDILFDLLHRTGTSVIPGWEPEKWPEEYDQFLRQLPDLAGLDQEAQRKWGTEFWEDKYRIWKDYQDRMFEIMDQHHRGELADHADFSALATELEIWESHRAAKKEFFSVLELARSRGYHPTRSFGRLASKPVLQELAASLHWGSFAEWHDFAYRFQAEKLRYGVMDHADFLTLCIDTLSASKWLVEKKKEFPKFGIRAKYVLYDEVQDNSAANNDLFRLLCAAPDVPYLAVAVGDTKQGIYGFRGATAYGFSSMIEAIKKRHPENVHYLSYSFRSHRKVVDLGNEVVRTLPSYRDTVKDSQCVFDAEGSVVIAPPLNTEQEEAEWVMPRVRTILETTDETVMVLHRNNLREHPLVPYVEGWNKDYKGVFQSHHSPEQGPAGAPRLRDGHDGYRYA